MDRLTTRIALHPLTYDLTSAISSAPRVVPTRPYARLEFHDAEDEDESRSSKALQGYRIWSRPSPQAGRSTRNDRENPHPPPSRAEQRSGRFRYGKAGQNHAAVRITAVNQF